MEALCKGIKLLSTNPENGDGDLGKDDLDEIDEGIEHEDKMSRLRNEWTARTLVSLAPRLV